MAAELAAAHSAEVSAFSAQAKLDFKAAKKEGGKRKAMEAEARNMQLEMELRARHRAEVQALDEDDDDEATVVDATQAKADAAAAAARDEEARQKKLEKARRKRSDKVSKERARELAVDEETLELEKTSERKAENEAIAAKLAPSRLAIFEVAADGHCLYRAVHDQLRQQSDKAPTRVVLPRGSRAAPWTMACLVAAPRTL
mmetsp:Transcript_957/g.3552  ORF Transcript_957/g.3552 Transcript_957/m.3552 type:complete len:201 (-) Transcript_957:366-968(-)